jgi:ATP-grasp domain
MGFAVVDPVSSGSDYVRKAAAHGLDCVVVVTSNLPEVFASQVARLEQDHPGISFIHLATDADDLSDPRLVGGRCTYVICGGETGAEVADELRERLDIRPRNCGDRLPRLDKFHAQEALREANLRYIHSQSISDRSHVMDLALSVYPVVVKPPRSAGTDGVRVVQDHSELVAAVDELLGAANAMSRRNDHLVIQTFITGIEFVVDGYVHGDLWRPASVCRYDKHLMNGIPTYRSLTWLERNEIPDAEQLEAYTADVLQALGVRTGSFHAEFFYTGEGWVLVEIGLRPHGGGHPTYTEAITGTSQVEMELACASTGVFPAGPMPALRRRGCVVFFSVDRPVRFHRSPEEKLRHLDGLLHISVNVGAGQCANPPRSLFDTFGLGFVVLSADSVRQLDSRAELARKIFSDCYS